MSPTSMRSGLVAQCRFLFFIFCPFLVDKSGRRQRPKKKKRRSETHCQSIQSFLWTFWLAPALRRAKYGNQATLALWINPQPWTFWIELVNSHQHPPNKHRSNILAHFHSILTRWIFPLSNRNAKPSIWSRSIPKSKPKFMNLYLPYEKYLGGVPHSYTPNQQYHSILDKNIS